MILDFVRAAAISLIVCIAFSQTAKAQNTDVASDSTKPVFVLVNGTFQWAGQWDPLANILKNEGYEVYAVTLTGLGEREHLLSKDTGLLTHIMDVANVMSWRDLKNVILVSHSYGGAVITGVAAREPNRVKHLVFIDTVPLDHGERLVDGFGPEVYSVAQRGVDEHGDGWLIPPDALRDSAKHTVKMPQH